MRPFQPTELRSWLPPRDALSVLEIVHRCVSCRTVAEFRALFPGMRALLAFDSACAVSGRLGPNGSVIPLDNVNLTYPRDFIEEYLARDYFAVDNLMRQALDGGRAQYCSEAAPGRPRAITALCRDFGIPEGYFVGARAPGALDQGSLFLFKRRRMRPDGRTAAMLELLAPHLQLAFSRAFRRDRSAPAPVALSPREREVMRWLCEGKSSWETSVIVGVSERTVNFHVYNVLRRLGAANRPQALAMLARSGALD